MADETAAERQARDVESQSADRKARNFQSMSQERAEREYWVDASHTLWTYIQTL